MAQITAAEKLIQAKGDHPYTWLADELGISRGYANNICRGWRLPSRSLTLRIHQRFGIRPEEWPETPATPEEGRAA